MNDLDRIIEGLVLNEENHIRMGIHTLRFAYPSKMWEIWEDLEYNQGESKVEEFRVFSDALSMLLGETL